MVFVGQRDVAAASRQHEPFADEVRCHRYCERLHSNPPNSMSSRQAQSQVRVLRREMVAFRVPCRD